MPQKDVWCVFPWLVSVGCLFFFNFIFHYVTHADLTRDLASIFKVILLTNTYHHIGKIPILNCAIHWVAISPFQFTQVSPLSHIMTSAFSLSNTVSLVESVGLRFFSFLLQSLPCFSDEINSTTLPSGFPIFIPPAQTCCSSALVTSPLIIIHFKSGISFESFFF